jgi:hypothetical protein
MLKQRKIMLRQNCALGGNYGHATSRCTGGANNMHVHHNPELGALHLDSIWGFGYRIQRKTVCHPNTGGRTRNGAGPQIWAVVSTPIFDMLRSMGYGAHFEAAISQDRLHFVGFAIVDDANPVQTTTKERQTFHDEAEQMQRALLAWEGGLKATGGAIIHEKSHWYLIHFIWDKGVWQYKTIEESPANIQIQDCTGTIKILERLEISEARQTLGVRLAPDGNNTEEGGQNTHGSFT